ILRQELPAFRGWKSSQWTFRLDETPPLAVYAVWLVSSQPSLKEYLTAWRQIRPYTSGYTLQQRGLVPSPQFREILTRLRAAWLDGEISTQEEEEMLLKGLIAQN